jgi:hypothetical protein
MLAHHPPEQALPPRITQAQLAWMTNSTSTAFTHMKKEKQEAFLRNLPDPLPDIFIRRLAYGQEKVYHCLVSALGDTFGHVISSIKIEDTNPGSRAWQAVEQFFNDTNEVTKAAALQQTVKIITDSKNTAEILAKLPHILETIQRAGEDPIPPSRLCGLVLISARADSDPECSSQITAIMHSMLADTTKNLSDLNLEVQQKVTLPRAIHTGNKNPAPRTAAGPRTGSQRLAPGTKISSKGFPVCANCFRSAVDRDGGAHTAFNCRAPKHRDSTWSGPTAAQLLPPPPDPGPRSLQYARGGHRRRCSISSPGFPAFTARPSGSSTPHSRVPRCPCATCHRHAPT